MLLVLTVSVTTEQQWGSPTTVANVRPAEQQSGSWKAWQKPTTISSVQSAGNTRKYLGNPGHLGGLPGAGFFDVFCLLTAEQQ